MKQKIYAAYGSNLNIEQMAVRCPDANLFGKAMLHGYEMVFRGGARHAVATIEPREGASVPIMLWSISSRDEQALDRYEGFPSFYGKEMMSFDMDGRPVEAMVYVMTPGHIPGMPSHGYYETIRQGYEDCGLDHAALTSALCRTQELMEQEPRQGFQMNLW